MRKTALLASAILAVLLAGGVARTATVRCTSHASCYGTNGVDKLVGTYRQDYMNAKQDNDVLLGRGGPDDMRGDKPDATLPLSETANDGNDKLYGNAGDDLMYGYGGDDLLRGGRGDDSIEANELQEFRAQRRNLNSGQDIVFGGPGKDQIYTRDAHKDTVDCGPGKDTVHYKQGLDVVADNCEVRYHP